MRVSTVFLAHPLAYALHLVHVMTTPTEPIRAFHARMRAEHAEMEGALQRLLAAYESGDVEVARTAFREFDKRLSAHLQMEDDLLLPAFADFDRAEADELSAQHRAIRAKVDELVIGSDLHLTRLPAVRELAVALRTHAMREDQILYRWIDRTYGDTQISPPSEMHAPNP